MQPKVSVIIPVYGVEQYIERCATSLFKQTLDDIEFIFVDDCSSDRSMEILNQIIERYRIRFAEKRYVVRTERMPTNSGLAAVRRHGIQLAKGDYIINCDSDDWVDVTMYEKMYNHAIDNDSDLVICDYTISSGNKCSEKTFKKNITDCSREAIFKCLLTSSTLNPVWSTLAKRELFNDMMYPVGDMGEDRIMMIQLAWKAKHAVYLPMALYYYYQSDTSITRTINREANIRKYRQTVANQCVILEFLERNKIEVSNMELEAFLFRPKIGLIENYLTNDDCRNLWMKTCPLKTWSVIANKYIGLGCKLKYIFSLVKVFLLNRKTLK